MDRSYKLVLQLIEEETARIRRRTYPQNTEGTEFLSLAITPNNSSNKLKITVTYFGLASTGDIFTTALFQDSTA